MPKDFISDEEMMMLEQQGQVQAPDFIPDEDVGMAFGITAPSVKRRDIEVLKAEEAAAKKESEKGLSKRFFTSIPGAAKDVLLDSQIKFGKAISTIGSNAPKQAGDEAVRAANDTTAFIKKIKSEPDPAKRQKLITSLKTIYGVDYKPTTAEEINPALGMSNKDVFLAAGGTALDITGIGKANNAAKSTLKISNEGKSGFKLAKQILPGSTNRANKQVLKEAIEVTKPVLSKSQQEAAAAAGRTITKGVIKQKVVTAPTGRDLDVAKSVQGIVRKESTPFDNISAIKSKVAEISGKVRSGLQGSNAIWNKNGLKGRLNTLQLPITVRSDQTLLNQANNFNKAVLILSERANKKAVGLLDLRQQVDDLIEREFPDLFDDTKTVKPFKQYILSVRDTINDYAAKTLPEGKLPDGTSFRGELKRQNLMLKAVDNIAERAPKQGFVEGSTRTSRFMQRNQRGVDLTKKFLKGVGVVGTAGGVGYFGGKMNN